MKVVIAIDSFKGSMSSMESGMAAKEGVLSVFPDAEVVVKPLADGGEGTVDAFASGTFSKRAEVEVTGPLGQKVTAVYAAMEEEQFVVMEMAAAAGITLVEEKTPLEATTYGVGEMMLDAMNKGYRDFIMGIGGSATNDGGVGMLQALGYRFLDENGKELGLGAKILGNIASIDDSKVNPIVKECRFRIACDVNNPLYGERGATYIFGPQKGVTAELAPVLDKAMQNYARVSAEYVGKDYALEPGAGAAGGLGFAFKAYLNAELLPGIQLMLDATKLEDDIKDADIVITGEGRLDGQTAMGKVPVGVAKLAKKYGVKVLAFAGAVTKDAKNCNAEGIDAFFPIVRGVTTLAEAMDVENAKANMKDAVEQVFRLLK